MNKPSKITVKHYLEKKVKPILIYGDIEAYPIYCRITYKRKTTNFKSFTGVLMSLKAYDYYCKNNSLYHSETHPSLTFTLDEEIKFIEQSIKRMTENKPDLDVFNEYFLFELKKYLEPIEQRLLELGWFAYHKVDLSKEPIEKKYYKDGIVKPMTVSQLLKIKPSKEKKRLKELYPNDQFYSNPKRFYELFNKENSLLYNIETFNKIVGLDISNYFFDGTLLYWNVIDLIIKQNRGKTTIEFLDNYTINEAHNLIGIFKKEEIESAINSLKNNILMLD
ncbi:hypothetical protein [Flavobacterium aquicola]|uniref:Uncharacterized protein n=1 Tax=Flavobacterium aquicola TaxID=1682742 RepID=A0A3E0E3X3_9FLAO|nr:hypothetical protein [Flavobacterium aquicola]REG92994.1 hypothetical protein C8P67_11495 [Flavobacterium aquicola]